MGDETATKKAAGNKPSGAPKFKAGDKVRHVPTGEVMEVDSVTPDGVRVKGLAGLKNPLVLEPVKE